MSQKQYNASQMFKFILPSLIGIFIFITPITVDGEITIPIAWLAEALDAVLEPILGELILILVAISVVGTTIYRYLSPQWMRRPLFVALFSVTPTWFVIRIIGLILAAAILFEWGPEWLWGEATGGEILGLASFLLTIFLFAGIFLPLLMNFGLLEFAGALLHVIMRPLFTMPGRSSIDSLASWLGDAAIGVLLTNQQYEQGFYTKREAAVLGTTFNIVSITFTIVVLGYLELTHMFLPYYVTIAIAGIVAAMIMPRIPPLSRKSEELYPGAEPKKRAENVDEPAIQRAWRGALIRADDAGAGEAARSGLRNVLEMWLAVIPIVMAIGTVMIIIAEHTPLFQWLGLPFIPLLELMQVPEAQAASETMLIGFADMLLPALIGADIQSEMTRFIIGAVSITQLIYMSEVGGMILGSKIPITFMELAMIFLLRTLITLPIIVLCAHIIF
ncbi:YjiH family protein [Natribacillus halophilus]|uniref:Nucleoside recognition GATE domain-containing membrane protein YjiH n=1 Tax=Natribacillus halophilus TaxID=549003 RepID=A0A1G8J7F6_9BACI|nr:YjiH family protein [Natribacillus halophilus]SDI27174.1 nucleoside recognition GATE domain-containing membrane protein YjiH [Natribacillus halophilus]